MRILFLQIAFPHGEGNSNLYTDLAMEFRARGHDVYVATLLEEREGKQTYVEDVRGAKVLHVKCGNLFGIGIVRKGLTMLSLGRRFLQAIRRHFAGIHFDLLICPTPPITFAPVVHHLKREQGSHTYLILRDIFPQNARDLGIIRDPLTYRYFRHRERQLYAMSDHIGCMSQGNIEYVLKHNNIAPSRLEILYNWEKVPPAALAADPSIRAKYDLEGKFVAVFGGNIGYAQELEFLLELARLYKQRSDIAFLIVGKGVAAAKIARLVQEQQLTNVVMKDFIPRDEFNRLLASCGVGLINLDRRFTIPNIPSKTLSYFAAGIPVLAAVDPHTDYGRLLDDCQAGLWSVTGDLPAYQRNFERLLNDADLRRRMGENGRRALRERFSVEQAYATIMGHFPER